MECADAKGDGGDGMAAWKIHTANAEELAEYAKESINGNFSYSRNR